MHTEKKMHTGKLSIHYAEGTTEGIPLVFLHGISLYWQSWLSVLPLFDWRYHVYAVDLRGHGQSDRQTGAYRTDDYAEDILYLLRNVVGRPAVVVGHSLGAMVAMHAGSLVPELFRGIVLEDPPITDMKNRQSPIYGAFSRWREWMLTEATESERFDALASMMPEAQPTSVRNRMQQFEQLDPDVLTHAIEHKVFENLNLDVCLPRIVCPVFLLQGNPELGAALSDDDAALVCRLVKDCSHVRMTDLGHSIHNPDPMRFYRTLTPFLESV